METTSGILLIMEDLNASGYTLRLHTGNVTLDHAKSCLTWLAHFHGEFMGNSPYNLWSIGTYWHLDTRPEEWEAMKHRELKQNAKAIDSRLKAASFQTIVHGDAKLANFCFHPDGKVAAVDFQYVGQGCGMKDVAYFISSCYEDDECEKYEEELLNHYFSELEMAMDKSVDFKEIRREWMSLYPYAWADFCRFLNGWSPGHWKLHGYSKRLTDKVLSDLIQ